MIPFHLAFPVSDIEKTREFYASILGCTIGRTDTKWIDFNFFGHQLSAHLRPEELSKTQSNTVDGDAVPVRHFGAVLPWSKWEQLAQKLQSLNYPFRLEPKIRFKGKTGEQGTFFIDDPSGNSLEFKSFKNMNMLFAR